MMMSGILILSISFSNSRNFLFVFSILLSFVLLCHSHPADHNEDNDDSNPKERLLMISMDGFRWNYLQRTDTPNFDRITSHGVQAVKGLTNAFITKTFPNHFTLVTGQWEESHGIIANAMYDPVLNESFSPHNAKANAEAAWFDQGGEPIWVTNTQNKDGKSGVIMWVGGGAPIKNVRPTKYMAFNETVKNETKIDTMIEWFKEDVNLGLIYFRQPDAFGHWFGPESDQVTRMIGGLDKLVGYLLKRLEEEDLLKGTNIIITSDHGFTSTPEDKEIDLNGVLDPSTFHLESATPVAGIWPYPGFFDTIYKNLTSFAEASSHMTVYRKEDIPGHFHYRDNRRIPPIIVVAENHYSFSYAGSKWHQKGNHGYDNRLQDMHPFFVAMGPAFKSNFTVETFQSVDVYPLMCHILGLQPAPNNGSMDVVGTLLRDADHNLSVLKFFKQHHLGSVLVGVILLAGLVTALVIVIRRHKRKRGLGSDTYMTMDQASRQESETAIRLSEDDKLGYAVMSNVPLLQDHDS